MSNLDSLSLATLLSILGAYMVLILAIAVLSIVAMWKVFVKAGEEGWKSIIPFYNTYILFKICWKALPFWIFLGLAVLSYIVGIVSAAVIPFSYSAGAVTGIISLVIMIAVFVIFVMLFNHLSKSFGCGTGFTVGLVLLNTIFILILGFGSAQYIGNLTEGGEINNSTLE